MSSVHDHERYQHDAGAYLLGALSDLEAQAFERHMESCAACRDEVERLRVAADVLPRAVEQFEPPPSLKRELMRQVRDEPESGLTLVERMRERLAPAWRPQLAWVPAVLIAGIIAGYLINGSSGGGTHTVAAQVDRTRIPSGSASLVLPSGDKNAILRVNGLPEPVGNQVYEVWLKRGNQPMPVSLFNVTSDGAGAAAIPEDLHKGDSVLVTREKPGGAPAPTEAPVIAAKVS